MRASSVLRDFASDETLFVPETGRDGAGSVWWNAHHVSHLLNSVPVKMLHMSFHRFFFLSACWERIQCQWINEWDGALNVFCFLRLLVCNLLSSVPDMTDFNLLPPICVCVCVCLCVVGTTAKHVVFLAGNTAKHGLRCKACKMSLHHKCENGVGQQRCMGKLVRCMKTWYINDTFFILLSTVSEPQEVKKKMMIILIMNNLNTHVWVGCQTVSHQNVLIRKSHSAVCVSAGASVTSIHPRHRPHDGYITRLSLCVR